MKRFKELLVRVAVAVAGTWPWIRRQIDWIFDQVSRIILGVLGPPIGWIMRGFRAIKALVERLVDQLLDILARVFRTARHDQGVPVERIGANATPLLATLSLAVLWYLLPLARWAGYGPIRFVVFGCLIWIISLLLWLSRCRSDRRGRVAQFVQGVRRSTGLRRLDQVTLVLAIWLCWMVSRDIQLLPLAAGAMISAVGLLSVEHEFRAELLTPAADFVGVQDAEPALPSGRFIIRDLSWTVHAHGRSHRHEVRVRIDSDDLQRAKDANPGSGAEDELVDWVTSGGGPAVDSLARQIHQIAFEGAYSLFATVACFVAAAQSVSYVTDEVSTGHLDYWRYPIETLAAGLGDCEDSAILLAALLRRAGYRCAMVTLPGHAAVAVEVPNDTPGAYFERNDVRYFYCETTDQGWKVGQVPSGIDLAEASFVGVPQWEAAA